MTDSQYKHIVRPYAVGFGAMLLIASPIYLMMKAGMLAAEYIWVNGQVPSQDAYTLPFLVGLLAGLLGMLGAWEIWSRTRLSEYFVRMYLMSETWEYPLGGEGEMSDSQYGLLGEYKEQLDFSHWHVCVGLSTLLAIQILTLGVVIPHVGSASDFERVLPSMLLLLSVFLFEPFWSAALDVVADRVMGS